MDLDFQGQDNDEDEEVFFMYFEVKYKSHETILKVLDTFTPYVLS